VLDPFFTTKPGKRTGLGLSLFRLAAEQAGGGLELGRSELGGTCVRAEFRLSHVDRAPLGDLAATVLSVLSTNPGLDLRCSLRAGGGERVVSVAEVAARIGVDDWLRVAREVCSRLRDGIREIEMKA
jgi:hypothetical protein